MKRHKYSVLWAETRRHLENALPEVAVLMAARFAPSGAIEADSPLTQSGLRDGAEIVAELLAHNELGLALEHLRYMIDETNLPVSAQTLAALQAAKEKMAE